MTNFDDLMSASFSDLVEAPTQGPISVSSVPQKNVIVFVSSRTFSILPSLFEQVKGLPWSESGGYKHLNAEPGHFEIILQFFLAGSFPGRVLVKQNKDALSKLVSCLGAEAEDLKICIEQGGGGRKGKMKKMGSHSSLGSPKALSRGDSVKKLLKSPFKSKKPETGELQESTIAMLANVPLVTDDMSDLGSEASTSTASNDSQKENPTTGRKDKQQRWSLGKRTSSEKLHQELCESEYIV